MADIDPETQGGTNQLAPTHEDKVGRDRRDTFKTKLKIAKSRFAMDDYNV